MNQQPFVPLPSLPGGPVQPLYIQKMEAPRDGHSTSSCCERNAVDRLLENNRSVLLPINAVDRWLENNTNVLLPVLEAASLRPGSQHGRVRACFWVTSFIYKGNDPIHEGSTPMTLLPNYPQRPHLPSSTCEFQEDTFRL